MKYWILEWLAEKTTWTGMFLVVSAFGFAPTLTDGQQSALIAVAVSFFAMNDRMKKK
jgi:hypothetical protein